jgi:NO-binding membrane sensor protein with MHYT domain
MSAVHCVHDPLLMVLSYLISVLGSFVALQLAIGIPTAVDSRQRWRAVLLAGAAMGCGAIWSMHFIAMLACTMHIPVAYDIGLTALSAVFALVSCSVGLALMGSGVFSWAKLAAAGVLMGGGVAGMHYTGMAAMLMPATTHYDQGIVILSVVIAIVASMAALWLAFNLRGWIQMLGSALVMGVAVCGMHYTGMYAATFVPVEGEVLPDGFQQGLQGEYLGATIFIVATLLLGAMLILNAVRQRQRAAVTI